MENINVELMEKVAAGLGFKLEAANDPQDSWRCYLTKGDMKLYVNSSWAKGQMYYVSGCGLEDQRGCMVKPYEQVEKTRDNGEVYKSWKEVKAPTCNFNPEKGVDRIISDLKRRILPEYEKFMEASRKKVEETKKYYNAMDAGIKIVCKAVGKKVPDRGSERIYVGSFGCGYIRELRVEGSGTKVRMEVECPLDLALEIFKLLKSRKKEEEA
jgi:hypothetical protein